MGLVILIIAIFGLYFYWDYGRKESDKRQAYIRTLQQRIQMQKSGINPDTMQPYDTDHSCDLHNQGCTCDKCKETTLKNTQLNKEVWKEYRSNQ